MRVLVACEFSGIVRDAFIARGHDAISCDLIPSERPGPHYQGDVRNLLGQAWDMMIAFPPCTYLARSGARWHYGSQEQAYSIAFIDAMMHARSIPRWAIENPVGALSKYIRPPDQIVQPWQFGHAETKATCLWLKDIPKLSPTIVMPGPYYPRVHRVPPGPDRWKSRSRTLPGIAQAMADQWGGING